MVRQIGRGVPDRHDGVADEFVDIAAGLFDLPRDDGQVLVHRRGQGLAVHTFRKGGEAGKVGEHDRDIALFAVKFGKLLLRQDSLYQLRCHIAPERGAERTGAAVEEQEPTRPA